jgi:hydantoinase/carbamoylase family amidase
MKTILDGINAFGRNETSGGFNRMGFSDADWQARRWLAGYMEKEGLAVAWDEAGNLFGRLGETDAPSIMAGSHTDTVPEGGAFDGTLGVAAALECALAIRDAGIELAHPIEVVNTAEEEGRFGGMLGSQAMSGQVDPRWLETARDPDGLRLWEAMERQGLDPARIGTAVRKPGSVKAFLELHVEQGPVLERAGIAVGIADRVSGVVNLSVVLGGVANHSGTTPMAMRADAFAGLAEVAAGIPDLIAAEGTDQSRVTIGKVELQPNFPHTIPGRAEFSVILRDTDAARLSRLEAGFRARLDGIAVKHGLTLATAEASRLAPVALDAAIADMLAEESARLGMRAQRMPSGAGHDAQTMQALCPSGLIFVPSRGGISHAPEEWTDWDDACAGARLMLAAMVRLAAPDA